jgi:hypothetical protein
MVIACADSHRYACAVPSGNRVLAGLVICGASLVGGWMAAHGHFLAAVALIPVCVIVVSAPLWASGRRGVLLGLLVLGAENGLPFLDTAQHELFGYALGDYMVIALALALALQATRGRLTPGIGALAVISYMFVIWWVITLWHSDGEPLNTGAAFGRNFLLFALLAVLFPLGITDARERKEMLLTFGGGALLYSIGEILITVTHHPLPWLVHPVAIRVSDVGLQRVYAFMADASVLLFCLALGAALLGPTQRLRRWGSLVALISMVAIILQQTRAIYLSLAIALLLVILWWALFTPDTARLTGRTFVCVVAVGTLVAVLAVFVPSVLNNYVGTPLSRLSGAFVQVSSGTGGNLNYRFHVAHDLLALLHGNPVKWATGLGFIDPAFHRFVGLPEGTIRNSDLGLVDGIMLIGLVGVVLTYLVALIPLRLMSIEARQPDVRSSSSWMLFGLILWLMQVLLASYSLGTLWQQSGQVLVAMVAGVGLQLCRPRPATQEALAYSRPGQLAPKRATS